MTTTAATPAPLSARERSPFGRFQLHPSHLLTNAPSPLPPGDLSPYARLRDPAQDRSAALLVCGRAVDVDDARHLLGMLDLPGGVIDHG